MLITLVHLLSKFTACRPRGALSFYVYVAILYILFIECLSSSLPFPPSPNYLPSISFENIARMTSKENLIVIRMNQLLHMNID